MYCIHCGKELEENGVCDCAQSGAVTPNPSAPQTNGDTESAANTANLQDKIENAVSDVNPKETEANPPLQETGQYETALPESDRSEPGEKSGFDKDAALNNVNEKFQKTAAVFSEEAKGLLKLIPPILKTPADGIKAYIEAARTATGLQLIGAKALITALLLLIMLVQLESSLGGWYTIPKAKPFFITLIFVFALDYAFGWIMYFFTTTVFKGTTTPQKMTALTGLRCLPEIAALVAGSICLILWPTLGLIVYISFFIVSITYLIEGYQQAADIDSNKWAYAVSAAYGTFVLVSMIALRLFASDFTGALNPFGSLF